MKLKVLFLLILISISQTVFAGEISGTVLLTKPNSKSAIGNVPMRLHVYKDDFEFAGVETKTDASGHFLFHDLQTGDQYTYIFYPVYKGVNYPYAEISFSKGKTSEKKDFVITESTGSTKDLVADEKIFFDIGKKDVWKVTHTIELQNKGDLLYHADRPDAEALKFALFEGGFDLSYLDGVTRNNSKIDEEKDTLQAFLTVASHDTVTLKFSYYYIPSKRHVVFDRPSLLARSNVSLFFHDKVRVISNQFQSDPMMAKTQTEYARAFTSGPVEQNGKINFEIKGFLLERDLLHMIVLALCLSLLIFMLVLAFGFKKTVKNTDKQLTERMHRYLMELNKKYKEGSIDEQFYKKESHRVRNFLFEMSKSDQK